VVQDLSAEGFKMAERRHGLDLPHCLLVMRKLARFHAASIVLHDRDPESMSLYDQSFFSEPATREGLQKFVSGTYHRRMSVHVCPSSYVKARVMNW
jgi:hypothetical protein